MKHNLRVSNKSLLTTTAKVEHLKEEIRQLDRLIKNNDTDAVIVQSALSKVFAEMKGKK